jgi:hypothetical protein
MVSFFLPFSIKAPVNVFPPFSSAISSIPYLPSIASAEKSSIELYESINLIYIIIEHKILFITLLFYSLFIIAIVIIIVSF